MDTTDLSDTLNLIEGEIGAAGRPAEAPSGPVGFDEAAYLRAFPDVARAVAAGARRSALDHYLECGQREGRLADLRYLNASIRGASDGSSSTLNDTEHFPACGIDAMFITPSGQCLVIGWLNEEHGDEISLFAVVSGSVVAEMRGVARCRRQDAEAAVASPPGKLLGFWALMRAEVTVAPGSLISIVVVAGTERRTMPVPTNPVPDERLRDLALEYMCSAQYYSNHQVEAQIQLESGLGKQLIDMNVEISRKVIDRAYSIQFGPRRTTFDASIVVCLYGKAEFFFLQAAFFSEAPGWEAYEFIYVSNSPELAEILVREATLASRIYGMSITLVILTANAGFGAANNVAVNFAQSSRIMIVNPDVFPRDRHWARGHSALIQSKPADEVAMFGVPLFYDDSSLMHAGMFFDTDVGLAVRHNGFEQRSMLRVEHYGKGAPPGTAAFLEPRVVPAVSGAFISVDRSWFESLGGFSMEYVFGHYEDADLCLKSLAAGKPVWLHNVPFWHLEGKGSTRLPVHESGSIVNRWHFTDRWGGFIANGLMGPRPQKLTAP